MFLIFVQPLISVLCKKLVCSKGSIYKAIDKGGSEILAGRVNLARAKGGSVVLQVRLVNVLWGFGVHDIQLEIQAVC